MEGVGLCLTEGDWIGAGDLGLGFSLCQEANRPGDAEDDGWREDQRGDMFKKIEQSMESSKFSVYRFLQQTTTTADSSG